MRDLAPLAALDGLISPAVGERLAALAAAVPAHQAIVEIGSYRGKSTSYLACGADRPGALGPLVYAVDPWELAGNATGRFGFADPHTHALFDATIARLNLKHRVVAMQGFSVAIAVRWVGPKIGLLYIDGSHLEKDVQADWDAWRLHLAPRAVVAFDDYNTPRNPGVKAVVDRLVGRRWEYTPAPLAIGFPR